VKMLHVALLVGLAAGACRDGSSSAGPVGTAARPAVMAREDAQAAAPAPAPALAAPPAAGGATGGRGPAAGMPAAVSVPTARKIVRNGSLSVEVPDLHAALATVRSDTIAAGGYVTNESQGRDEFDVRQGSITCRIPAEKLDATLAKFQALGRVQSVSVQAEDITEQYFNLEIRLRNQQQLESRLLKLLDQPGNKVSDLVEVEREVARVRSEIDELEGRKRFWDSQVSLSTLTVELHEPRPAIVGEGGGILDTLKRAFRSAGENVVGTVAWFIAAAGVVIPAAVVLWVLWRIVKALRARRKKV
jgi:hypothetical protein